MSIKNEFIQGLDVSKNIISGLGTQFFVTNNFAMWGMEMFGSVLILGTQTLS